MFSFRFRIEVAPGCSISTDEETLRLYETPDGQLIELIGKQGIAKSAQLVLKAQGWQSSVDATESGNHFSDILALALVRHRVGAEMWARRRSGMFFPAGLRMLEEQRGQRVLNDQAGLMVYESEPAPRFASMNATVVRGVSAEHFAKTFQQVASAGCTLTDRARVAIDLFNASFFEPAGDTRLVVLVMAVEALLEPAPRSADAVALVNSFIAAVKVAALQESEQASLQGALVWLRRESIRSAGRRLAIECLGANTYDGRPAETFFADCYDLRSELVHGGDIRRARERAGAAVGQLEVFVSDLIFAKFAG